MRRARLLVLPLLVLLLALVAIRGLPASGATREAWLADYGTLRRHLESAYANLLDRAASRKIDLPALDEATRARLAAATTRGEARRAVGDFVAAFDDAHFQARTPKGPLRRWLRRLVGTDRPASVEPIPAGTAGAKACGDMGYRARGKQPLDWASLPGWKPLPGSPAVHPFPSGTVEAGGRRLAILRIPLLSSEAYPELCAATWDARRADGPPCDADCQDAFSLEVDFALADGLARQAEALAATGATTLLVDLSGNGGGSSVSEPLARTLTPLPLRRPDWGFVRHPHWASRFARMDDDFAEDLARPSPTPRQRELVVAAREEVARLRRVAETPCDLSTIWRRGAPPPPCSNVVRMPALVPYAAPGSLDGLDTKGWLFNPSQYRYREGAWRGELVVVTDGDTASASEEFAAILADNGAARIAGAPTLGIGCGYTNGGITLELPSLGMTVRAPDCVRYRADGTNEAEPIRPDLPAGWTEGDDAATRARKVVAAVVAAGPRPTP